MGNKVLAIAPGYINPFPEASEIEITGRSSGRIAIAPGFGNHGEPVRCTRAASGKITEIWLAGTKLLPAGKMAREMEARYVKRAGRKRKR